MVDRRQGLALFLTGALSALGLVWILGSSRSLREVPALDPPRDRAAARTPAVELAAPLELEERERGREGEAERDPTTEQRKEEATSQVWAWERCLPLMEEMMQMTPSRVEGLRRLHVRWPWPLTAEYVREELDVELDALAVGELEAAVEHVHFELDAEVEVYAAFYDAAYKETFQRQLYQVHDASQGEPPAEALDSTAVYKFPGWVVTFTIDESTHPELGASMARMNELKSSRRARAEAVLAKYR